MKVNKFVNGFKRFDNTHPINAPISMMNASNDPEIRDDWQVIRLDDNGNVFLVANHLSEIDAKNLVKAYEAKGHKQTYWAKRNIPT